MDVFLMKNVCPAGKQAVLCFSLSLFVFTLSFFSGSVLGFSSELWALTYWGPGLYFCLFNFILRYCYKGFPYEVNKWIYSISSLNCFLFLNFGYKKTDN